MGHYYFPTPYSIFFLSTSVRVPLYPIHKCTFRKVMFRQNVSHRRDAVAQHNGALLKLGRLVTAQCGSRTHRLAEVTSFSGHLLPTSTSIPLDIMEKDSIIRTRSLLQHFCGLMSECSRMVPTQKRNLCEPCQSPTCIKQRKRGRSTQK